MMCITEQIKYLREYFTDNKQTNKQKWKLHILFSFYGRHKVTYDTFLCRRKTLRRQRRRRRYVLNLLWAPGRSALVFAACGHKDVVEAGLGGAHGDFVGVLCVLGGPEGGRHARCPEVAPQAGCGRGG